MEMQSFISACYYVVFTQLSGLTSLWGNFQAVMKLTLDNIPAFGRAFRELQVQEKSIIPATKEESCPHAY